MIFMYVSSRLVAVCSSLFFALSMLVFCQAEPMLGGGDAYRDVVTERAIKIVDRLGLIEGIRSERVAEIIATQYVDLQKLHKERDAAIKLLVEKSKIDGQVVEPAIERLKADCQLKVAYLHYAYLAQLRAELSPDQIESVKDGMTYGVLPLTFQRYMDLLPDLEDVHRRWVYATLVEAREYAIDEGSAKEKHQRFGKHKGRINNYMSKLGINMKEAEIALAEKEAAKAKK